MYASRTVKPNSIEYYLEKQEADTAIQSLIQNQAQENSKDSQFKSTSNSKQLKLDSNVLKPQPARTNTALRIDQRIPNKELRSRLKLQSDEYFSLNNQGNTPYNRIYTNTVKETITAYTKLCQLVPNQDQIDGYYMFLPFPYLLSVWKVGHCYKLAYVCHQISVNNLLKLYMNLKLLTTDTMKMK
ncbi:hypothetical protein TVAG_303980 [Trichomonas vaginalis G3]|uniref:Uncharacterized protein n=1 Tax=Trichomonas vaginalis (strain ATCC PRA-98 / G3) TaxID=412133 RepID=A2G170_TRIV3|nr:hypothetical protein TVAG_303980 [Trichomonas vaginalis G3]|eukprot:XP_001302017.1 hypothetical protein [Trichomonas vaginalis G3]